MTFLCTCDAVFDISVSFLASLLIEKLKALTAPSKGLYENTRVGRGLTYTRPLLKVVLPFLARKRERYGHTIPLRRSLIFREICLFAFLARVSMWRTDEIDIINDLYDFYFTLFCPN